MAYTTSDLDSVRIARLRGLRTVTIADRTVTYASDAEMKQLEADIRSDLASRSTTRRSKQTYLAGSSGF